MEPRCLTLCGRFFESGRFSCRPRLDSSRIKAHKNKKQGQVLNPPSLPTTQATPSHSHHRTDPVSRKPLSLRTPVSRSSRCQRIRDGCRARPDILKRCRAMRHWKQQWSTSSRRADPICRPVSVRFQAQLLTWFFGPTWALFLLGLNVLLRHHVGLTNGQR